MCDILYLGSDESFEIAKATLLSAHPEVAAEAWNDQPWGYSQFLTLLYGDRSPGFLFARCIVAAINCGLIFIAGSLIGGRRSATRGIITVALLLILPGMPELILSPMLEVPSFGLAYVSLGFLMADFKNRRASSVLSGLFLGLAVHVKLVALLVLPAIALVLAGKVLLRLMPGTSQRTILDWDLSGVHMPLYWLIGAVGAFVAGVLLSPNWDASALWNNHQMATSSSAFDDPSYLRFHMWTLLDKAYGVLPAGLIGVWFYFRRKSYHHVAVLGTAVIVPAVVHSFHRPYWEYYDAHFFIPIAIIAAGGLLSCIALVCRGRAKEDAFPWPAYTGTVCCVVFALCSAYQVCAALRLTFDLRSTKCTDPTVTALRANSDPGVMCYDRYRYYAYSAGLVLPPELLVLPLKRFWSGAIDERRIYEFCRFGPYRPEILIVDEYREFSLDFWRQWLEKEATLVHQSGRVMVWTLKKQGTSI